jgi:hypothetical protein
MMYVDDSIGATFLEMNLIIVETIYSGSFLLAPQLKAPRLELMHDISFSTLIYFLLHAQANMKLVARMS